MRAWEKELVRARVLRTVMARAKSGMGRRRVGEGSTGSAPIASAGVARRWRAVGGCAACLAKARALIGRCALTGSFIHDRTSPT